MEVFLTIVFTLVTGILFFTWLIMMTLAICIIVSWFKHPEDSYNKKHNKTHNKNDPFNKNALSG